MNIIKHSYNWRNALKKRARTDYIIYHHIGAVSGTVEGIHKYHRDTRGWSGIGYNFVIYKNGTIHEGRGLEYVGAHCTDYNSVSVGVAVVGEYENLEKEMPVAQYKALLELTKYLKKVYPKAELKKHKDFANTDCCGQYFPFDKVKNYEKSLTELSGKNSEVESMERYKTIEDVPEAYSDTVAKYVSSGVIKGRAGNILDLSEDMCRMLVYVDRILGGK